MSAPATAAQLTRLKELGAATIYEAQGQRGAISSSLRPIDPSLTVVGRALTVDCGPADNLMLHAALEKASPGDVLVADAKGFIEAGAWGDVLTAAAQQVGVVGLIINGSVRDAQEIIEMGFPIYSKGLSIRGTSKTYKGTVGQPVDMAGTTVHTGDIVVGDRDGLVVIAESEVAESLRLAELRENKETGFREKIEQGATTVELLGLRATLDSYFPSLRAAKV